MISTPDSWSHAMPRPARLNIPGIPQHVTQRGNNHQACFFMRMKTTGCTLDC
jgi:hypothetical protein